MSAIVVWIVLRSPPGLGADAGPSDAAVDAAAPATLVNPYDTVVPVPANPYADAAAIAPAEPVAAEPPASALPAAPRATTPVPPRRPSRASPRTTPVVARIAGSVGDPIEAGETVVRVRRPRRAATSARTSVAEARRLPGTQGDAIRVIESLPGVGRTSFATGQLIVWGAPAEASRTYVDGVPVPSLFHYGGLRSTLNGFFVQSIELTPAAFGAEWGRATAGMVQVETSALRDGVHGVASADLLDANAAVSARLGRGWYVAGGFRYGYLDRLAPRVATPAALSLVAVPQYFDYQARVEYRAGESERLTLLAFGSSDALRNAVAGDDPARARTLALTQSFHRVVLRYTARTRDGARVALSLWGGANLASDAETVGPFPFSLGQTAAVYGGRASWLGTLARGVRLDLGVDVEGSHSVLARQGSLLRPAREGDVFVFGQAPSGDFNADAWHVDQVSAAPYASLPMRFLDDRIELVPGVRLDATVNEVSRRYPRQGDTPSYGNSTLLAAVEPRFTGTVRALRWLSLKGAFGVHNAPPQPADLSSVFGNPALGYTRSLQGLGGATVQFSPAISLEVVGFYRYTDGYVSRAPADALRAGAALLPSGIARAYGVQGTLRHAAIGPFTGWITYTLSRSEVVDRPGASVRLADQDQTHLLTAVGSLQLPLGFSIGARFRFLSGLPRTPVVGRYFDTLTADYQPVFGATNSDRLPPIYLLDLRVDRRFRLHPGELTLFLDAVNVLNQPPAEQFVYDPTYAQRGVITGLPFFADVGARWEF